MPCYSPLKGYKSQDGCFTQNPRYGISPLTVPCGQCVGCRLERSRQWAIRCTHEASLYHHNCFITLTYASEHLPAGGSLDYVHFQEFMKRLRFHYKGRQPLADGSRPIRFYMAGEYGENFGRPHFHACIFNFDFDDRVLWKKTSSGSFIYRSKKLEELWPFGFSSVGDFDFKSAAYVARYIMKKITGRNADSHYETIDLETGEILWRKPEFNKMSLKPGIGARWFEKFHTDVYPHDYVIHKGRKLKPPRFYDKLYSSLTAESREVEVLLSDGRSIGVETVDVSLPFEELKLARQEAADLRLDDNTPERLLVKEQVTLAKLKTLKRKLL